MKYNEDTLVQETTANYLRDQLGWESVYAYNEEKFGREGTLGRKDETEVVLTRYLGEALIKLNPGLPQEAYQAAIREITEPTISQSRLHANREKYNLLREGVLVSYSDEKGTLKKARLRVFDFQDPASKPFSLRSRALDQRSLVPPPGRHRRLRQRLAASLYGTQERPPRFAARL